MHTNKNKRTRRIVKKSRNCIWQLVKDIKRNPEKIYNNNKGNYSQNKNYNKDENVTSEHEQMEIVLWQMNRSKPRIRTQLGRQRRKIGMKYHHKENDRSDKLKFRRWYISAKTREMFRQVLNAISTKYYTGITLTDIPVKVFTIVIEKRLEPSLDLKEKKEAKISFLN